MVDEGVAILSQQLARRPAQQALRFRVDESDLALGVHDHQAFGHHGGDVAQALGLVGRLLLEAATAVQHAREEHAEAAQHDQAGEVNAGRQRVVEDAWRWQMGRGDAGGQHSGVVLGWRRDWGGESRGGAQAAAGRHFQRPQGGVGPQPIGLLQLSLGLATHLGP